MSTRDLTTNIELEVLMNVEINVNGAFSSQSVDISDSDGGFTFFAGLPTVTDGTYVITLQDSPDNSVWTDVPVAKLNDPIGNGDIILLSQITVGDTPQRLGAFGTEKWIRARINASGVTLGAFMLVYVIKKPELRPV